MDFYVNGYGLRYGNNGLSEFLAKVLPERPQKYSAPDVDLKSLLPNLNLRRISSSGRLALQAACQALLSGLPGVALPLQDESAPGVGLYIGSALGAVESSFSFMDSILDGGAQLASPTHFSYSVNNVYSGLLSLGLNIQGPSCTVCQFGVSFAGACQAALSALWSGEIEYALLGAVEQASESMNLVKAHARLAGDFSAAEHDCAVFFLLSARSDGPALAFPRWLKGGAVEFSASHSLPDDWQRFYAGHPAEQALDLAAVALSGKSLICRLIDHVRGIGAELEVSFKKN